MEKLFKQVKSAAESFMQFPPTWPGLTWVSLAWNAFKLRQATIKSGEKCVRAVPPGRHSAQLN